MPFAFMRMQIPDVILVRPSSFEDERGYFLETYKSSSFIENGINAKFLQDNLSFSKKGTLRGIHFQKSPYAQGKLVSVVSGSIFDVAVDLRNNSKTFGHYVSVNLTGNNHMALWIPQGFGHGFVALEDSFVMYKATNEYNRQYDSGILWNDSDIGIDWPAISQIVSEKDKKLMTFASYKEEMVANTE
jgi:dTDP-4-dehydrorhamnose 3,5-epimerase